MRQLLSRFGTTSSRERLRRGQRPSPTKNRRALVSESLEKRELLAGDILLAHNYLNPADVDDNMQITASDALRVINAISRSNSGGIEVTEAGQVDGYMDVNADGWVTASDALSVINAVSRGEAASAGVQLFLNLRDVNDAALTTETDRTATINTDDVFYLEVSYSDERTFGADIGAFQVVTDILVDQADVLTPIVTDTDEINIESSLRSATSGTATFSLEGSTEEVTLTLDELSDLDQAIKNAVVTLGDYDPDTIVVTPLQGEPLGRFPGQVTPTPTNDSNFQFRIRYNDFDLANQDLPDLQVSFDMDVTVRSEVISTSPLDENGNIRGSAVGLNLDTRSRTAPAASPFGREIYNSLTLGTYIADDGNGGSLFDNFLAVGPLSGAGIEGAVPGFEEPFDTFSIPLRINSAVQNLTFSLGLAGGGDDFLLYGEEGDEAILTDNQIEFDPVLSSFTLNVVDPNGGNGDPIVAAAITETFNEDQAVMMVDLLTGASDPDGDTLSISTPAISGNQAGVSVVGNTLNVDPSAYGALNDGESEVITLTYNVLDGEGGMVAQTATITITGITDVDPNQDPVVAAPITQTFNEDQAATTVDLLMGASDPDSDTLSISTPTITGDPQSGVSVSGTTLNVTPSVYGALNDGESQVISVAYNVLDGNGGSVAQTATITITGITDVDPNQDPVVSATITQTVSEDDAASTIDLLTGASDPDGDTLSISTPVVTDDPQSAVSISGTTLTVTPSVYGDLNDGESQVVTVSYNVLDGNGGSVAQTATITITGVTDVDPNQDPVVSAAITRMVNEDQAPSTIDLLENASDPDGDTLSISAPTVTGDPQSGVSVSGTTLTLTPSAYGSLNDGETQTITVNYNVLDGNGGSAAQTATITITGITDIVNQDPVVSAPIAQTFSENDSATTVNLLSGANDPDGDPLSISTPSITGDQSGISVSGSTLTVTPSAYSGLTDDQNEVITLTYDITDGNGGSVTQTATITITGINDAPVANNDSATAVRGVATTIDVLGNDNAGPAGEDQSLTVIAAASEQGTVDINSDGTLTFTSTGSFAGEATINYTIEDSDGATDSAVVTVTVTDFVPVTLSGSLFIDNVESTSNPVRDGIKNGPDAGIGGIQVRLVSSTGTTVASTLTSLSGDYAFTDVSPGNYTVVYDLPDTIRTLGSTTSSVVVDPSSSTAPTIPGLSVAGTQNTGLETINLLSSNYLRRNGSVAGMSNGGLEGGSVSFDANGNQEMFIAGEGFEDVVFGEVILSSFGDTAVMVIVREGASAPEAATLDSEFFIQAAGSRSIQFFGGVDDFDFNEVDGALGSVDLARYQAAVDRALSEL
ncbi:cadherin-like domain-containing protein [Rubripirellula obstinata]|uniref:cadherin-like domain-containing protein n=1 Tax=Rubripirellula obstinata TaxID=406547 RepID=UPI0013582F35|nr:cadherin-like domain-containing protein [Rubripirellula obstinata]